MTIAETLGTMPCRQIADADICQHTYRAIEQGQVYQLAAPATLTGKQGRQYSLDRIHARYQVGDRHPKLHGISRLFACDRHQPALGLDHKIVARLAGPRTRSEEHTSELQSLMRNSYAVFCWKKKTTHNHTH